ncbi:hypothetical protein QCA50_002643 [Cerrena zonata]|uniref:DUF6534 domain-containing protein n=1 Tax=Cerrena zonata TaxID=2478898 RepID=A0AAW0GSB2_9APHY
MTNSLSAITDGVIAITMIVLLWPTQKGFNYRMDSVLRWAITYTVNTGAISMIVSVTIAITHSILKHNLIFAGLVILTAKLYANALLGMLNARHRMRQKIMESIDPNAIDISGLDRTLSCERPRDSTAVDAQRRIHDDPETIIPSSTRIPVEQLEGS